MLVDEYQDTNRLQSSILLALKPGGAGLTVVGDDAQSIYSFRAATVRNILDFPNQFSPAAEVICQSALNSFQVTASKSFHLARPRRSSELTGLATERTFRRCFQAAASNSPHTC